MTISLNRSTQILIDNFIGTYFSNIPSENRAKIRDSVVEIADSLLEQSNNDLDKLATKGDLRDENALVRDEIALVRDETQKEFSVVKDDIKRLELKIIESKYDLLKWLITAQLAIAGLLLAMIKLI